MVKDIRIAGRRIDVPEGLNISLEENSPLSETGVIVGDFSQGITIRLTPTNRLIFGNPQHLALTPKLRRFENVEIFDEHFGNIRGVFLLQNTYEEDGAMWADFDFFTNLLDVDIFSETLSDMLTKVVTLGTSTSAIASFARGLNNLAMSTNGASGAVVKFPCTYGPDFYGGNNNDWLPEHDKYDPDQAYADEAYISFRMPYGTTEHGMNAANVYAQIPRIFRANQEVFVGQTPLTHPAKWDIHNFGVFNAYNGSAILANYGFDETLQIANRYALLPYIQAHDILREIGAAIDYEVVGEYMRDTLEQRALLQSSLALDKSSGTKNYAFVGQEDAALFETAESTTSQYLFWPLSTGIYSNPGGRITDDYSTALDPAPHSYLCLDSGTHQMKITAEFANQNNQGEDAVLTVREFSGDPFAYDGDVYTETVTIPGTPAQGEVDYDFQVTLAAGKRYLLHIGFFNTAIDVQVLSASWEVINLETDFLNIYEGDIKYADHVPNVTAAEFLEAFRIWKNLLISFDGKERTITLDYADNAIKTSKGVIDLDPYAIANPAQRVEHRPKKHFSLNYSELPDVYTQTVDDDEIEAVASVTDLPIPNSANEVVLVKAENAYYRATRYEYGRRLYWEFAGANWPDLKVEDKGDELYEVKPKIKPVAMRRFGGNDGDEYTGVYFEGEGRSSMFLKSDDRGSIAIAYWTGMDTSTVTDGYPHATTTKTNSAGTTVLPRSMQWLDQYNAFWKRTLQSIVLEEIITRSFMIPASISQTLQWSKLVMLHHTPAIILKRLRGIGIAQRQQLEMRKLKLTEISVVVQVVVEETEVEVEAMPPALTDLLWWFDFNKASTLTLSGANITGVESRGGDWPDLVGTNQPQYDDVNKRATFNGTDNYLESHYEFPAEPDAEACWCVVIEIDTIVNFRNYAAVTAGSNDYSSVRAKTSGPRLEHVSNRWYSPPSSIVQTMAGTVSAGTKYLFFVQADGTNFKWYLNGVLIDTDAGDTGWNRRWTNVLSFTLGGSDFIARQFGACKVYESIAYLHAPSDTDRAALFTYLNDKWSIY